MKNLSEKALLVNLTITLWSASKTDKRITKEVEAIHNATNAGRFNKILIAKKELEEIKKIATNTRSIHYEYTLPWGDNGDRLLPSLMYLDYMNKMRNLKQEFDRAVDEFIIAYPDLKADAKNRLNGMFNEGDYPSVFNLRTKFDMKIEPMAIAKVDDIRITVNDAEIENLRNEIESNFVNRIKDATTQIWVRISEAVNHMYEKLSDKDAVFRDSLVNNIKDLIDLLPKLNFTQDEDISRTIEDMKQLIVTPSYLRSSHNKRSETAEKAKELLNKINDFI